MLYLSRNTTEYRRSHGLGLVITVAARIGELIGHRSAGHLAGVFLDRSCLEYVSLDQADTRLRLGELDDVNLWCTARDRGSMHQGIDMSQGCDREMLVCFVSRRSPHRVSSPAVSGKRARNVTCSGRRHAADIYFAGWVAALCVPNGVCLGGSGLYQSRNAQTNEKSSLLC